jgi:hypothetical protein
MTKKEIDKRLIYIYWWNMGTKTPDFKGTYKEWLAKNEVKVTTVKRKDNDLRDYKVKFTVGGADFTIKYSIDCMDVYNLAIKCFLTYLGDKALLIDGHNRTYKINWR